MTILLTGYTGNVGVEIARQLASHRILAVVQDVACAPQLDGVKLIEGSLEHLPGAVQEETEVIVHAAASVAFKSPLEELRRTNVDGTAALLEFARGCPRLRRFVHVSTICVHGDRTGAMTETPVDGDPLFVNGYEQSKWEAEQLVLDSELPAEIVRLAIVAGSERDGAVRRPGALHHALYWLYKGLIPMIPGTPEAGVDLISTEFAARVIASTVDAAPQPGRIVHASAGSAAPRLAELLDFLAVFFAKQLSAARAGQGAPAAPARNQDRTLLRRRSRHRQHQPASRVFRRTLRHLHRGWRARPFRLRRLRSGSLGGARHPPANSFMNTLEYTPAFVAARLRLCLPRFASQLSDPSAEIGGPALDSIDSVEFLCVIHEAFGVRLTESEFHPRQTIGGLMAHIAQEANLL